MVAILDSYFGSNGPLMVFNFIVIIFLSIKKHTKAIKPKGNNLLVIFFRKVY